MASALTSSSSSKVAALAALFMVLVMYAEAGSWLPAKATWYGAPDGAGPDDNGTYVRACDCDCQCPCACISDVAVPYRICRRRVWVQAHQPVPVHVHDVVRQRAAVQGRQGLRRMLPGICRTSLSLDKINLESLSVNLIGQP
jgi:hypothetical protein